MSLTTSIRFLPNSEGTKKTDGNINRTGTQKEAGKLTTGEKRHPSPRKKKKKKKRKVAKGRPQGKGE